MGTPLNIQAEITRLQTKYAATAAQPTYKFLILGKNGVGKTQIARTAWLPVHIDSFDFNKTTHLIKEVNEGKILIDTSWEEMAGKQEYRTMLITYINSLRERKRSGYFSRFGTYMLDGITGLTEGVTEAAMEKMGRKDGVLLQSDYKMVWRLMREAMGEVATIPCDVIVTGHLEREENEITGRAEIVLLFPGKFKFAIGNFFGEIYVLQSQEDPNDKNLRDGIRRTLLTRATEQYTATTQLGYDGKFAVREPPDIMALRRKAGKDVEHKALLK